jgi:hypothetical protein
MARGPEARASHSGFLADGFRCSQDATSLPNFFAPTFIWAEEAVFSTATPRFKSGGRNSAHVHDHFQFRMVFAGSGSCGRGGWFGAEVSGCQRFFVGFSLGQIEICDKRKLAGPKGDVPN